MLRAVSLLPCRFSSKGFLPREWRGRSRTVAMVASGGLDEVAILGVNPLAAFMTFKRRRIEYIAYPGAAPGAFALGFAEADHRAENRGKYAADNHGHTENGAKAGEAQHCSNDDAHGRHDHPEEQAGESTAHGRLFPFG
jgi:hypothetical protein